LSIGGKPVGQQEPPKISPENMSLSPTTVAGTGSTSNVRNNVTVQINANNPLDAQEAGRNVVNAIGKFQNTNGDFNTALSGVGS